MGEGTKRTAKRTAKKNMPHLLTYLTTLPLVASLRFTSLRFAPRLRRPVPVCTWLNSEAEWFVQDAMQGKKAKHIVRVAVSLSTLVDDRYDDAFFSLLNGTVLEKLRKRIDFHDACKLLWALTVKSSFRPEYSRVNVLWEKIVDEWGGEDVGKMVKTRKGGIRKINEAEKMAPHMRRNSTHREGKKR